jgi:uncharacterized membrane protein YkvA (DUF1232 family)
MSLFNLLTRGVREALAEGGADLEAFLAEGAHEEGTAEHLRQCLEAMPGLLVALDGALRTEAAPLHARALFMVVVGYLLQEDDLIPVHEGEPLLGLLDDTYVLHRAAQELRDHVQPVDLRSVDGGVALLRSVLPRDVVRRLDATVEEATAEAAVLSRR